MAVVPKGYKKKTYQANQDLLSSVPTDEDFNPYDFIDQSHYKNTDRGRMAYQEDLAKLLYMAQINQEDRMNEYNSPTEQAKRMREAGINPDLNGVENHGATNVAGYQGNPMDGTQSTLQNVSDVVGTISSVTGMVSSLMSGMSTISMNGMQKFASAIGAGESLFRLFDNSDSSEGFLADYLPGLSRSQKKMISDAEVSYRNSERGQYHSRKNMLDKVVTGGELSRYLMDPKYSEDIEEYSKAWQPYIDALSEFAVEELKGKTARSKYDQSFYSSDSGESDRSYQNSTQQMFKQFKEPLIKVMQNFDKNIKDPTLRANAKAALAAFILKLLPL